MATLPQNNSRKVNHFLVVLLNKRHLANFPCGMDIFRTDYIKDQKYMECHKARKRCYLVGFETLSNKKMILFEAEQFKEGNNEF